VSDPTVDRKLAGDVILDWSDGVWGKDRELELAVVLGAEVVVVEDL